MRSQQNFPSGHTADRGLPFMTRTHFRGLTFSQGSDRKQPHLLVGAEVTSLVLAYVYSTWSMFPLNCRWFLLSLVVQTLGLGSTCFSQARTLCPDTVLSQDCQVEPETLPMSPSHGSHGSRLLVALGPVSCRWLSRCGLRKELLLLWTWFSRLSLLGPGSEWDSVQTRGGTNRPCFSLPFPYRPCLSPGVSRDAYAACLCLSQRGTCLPQPLRVPSTDRACLVLITCLLCSWV